MRNLFIILCVIFVNSLLGNIVFYDDFESAQIDTLNWTSVGNADWLIDDTVSYEGSQSVRSGVITDYQQSSIQTTVNINAGDNVKISFYYKVSSEQGWDKLNIYINNDLIDSYSGEIDWTYYEYEFISEGENIIKFEYLKDWGDFQGSDCAWIDNIVIETGNFIEIDMSLISGFYQNTVILFITCSDLESDIYYTDDGTEPDITSKIYNPSEGIPFSDYSGSLVIKAIAYSENYGYSSIKTGIYTILTDGSFISGEWSGTLSKSESPFYVMGDISVPNGDTLIIKPGVEMLFTGNYSLNVYGCLKAEGLESDRIKFTMAVIDEELFENDNTENGGWGGINFDNIYFANSGSLIDYCDFSYGKVDGNGGAINIIGTSSHNPDVSITNSDFRKNKSKNSGGAIYINDAKFILIENNNIIDNSAGLNGGGIFVADVYYYTLLKDNNIENNIADTGGGIYIGSDVKPNIINNFITGNKALYSGSSIYASSEEYKLYNNFISGNGQESESPICFLHLQSSNDIEVFNNTIVNNKGIILFDGIDSVNFKNNIIYNNNEGSNQFSGNPKNSGFYNCIIQNGESNLGDLFTGIFANCIDADPEIEISDGYSLTGGSPCINFGDSSVISASYFPITDLIGNDRVYNTIIDIGAQEYQAEPTRVTVPEFSHLSGTYYDTQYITITCHSENAEIKYTLDGNEPDENSILYSGIPIPISAYTVIKAKAFKSGMSASLASSIELDIIQTASGVWTKVESPVVINTNMEILAGDSLRIEPGVQVIFTGNYELKINGKINAIGTAEDIILFTMADPTDFSDNTTNAGGWKGINIYNSNTEENKFEYCKFEYGKKMSDTGSGISGGISYIYNSKVSFENCIFQSAKAVLGGAVYSQNSFISLISCLISKTYTESGVALYISGSYQDGINRIINCTFAGNELNHPFLGGNVSVIGMDNGASAELKNSIVWGNNFNVPGYQNSQICIVMHSDCLVSNCIIEGGEGTITTDVEGTFTAENTLDADPRFTGDAQHPYSLLASSPCVNMGDNSISNLPDLDLAGNLRIYDSGTVDIGAYELQTEAYSNPVLQLSVTDKFEFTENNETDTLFISNQGNAELSITFSCQGLSDSFSIGETDEVILSLSSYEERYLVITYSTIDQTQSQFDILNYSSNDLENNIGSIELFGGQVGYPDLIIDSYSVPTEGWMTGLSTEVSWTVKNDGDAPTDTNWKDKISLIRIDPASGDESIVLTKDITNLQFLTPKSYYTNHTEIDIDQEIDISSNYKIEFTANAYNVLVGDNAENNSATSEQFNIERAPGADFIVSGTPELVNTSEYVGAATEIEIKWTVKNVGNGQPDAVKWYDSVYLSPDSLNVNINPLLGKFEVLLPDSGMANEDSLTMTAFVTIPHFANTGTGHIYIVTDSDNNVYEGGTGELNNVSLPLIIIVSPTNLPDLVSEITLDESADAVIFTGDSIFLTGKVNNAYNNNPPFESSCRDRIYLSTQNTETDFDPLDSYVLGTYRKTGIDTLLVSEGMTEVYYSFQSSLTIPLNTGIDADSIYFDSYLFSNPEVAKNTLKYFGYENLNEEEIPDIVSELKSKVASKINSTKSDIKLEQYPRDYFLYMFTDYDNKVYEGPIGCDEESNNVSNTPLTVKISPWADLKVDTVSLDNNSLMPGDTFSVTWEVINQGDTTAFAGWTDKIYLSPKSKWDKDKSKLLGEVRIMENLDTLSGSNTYLRTTLFIIPEDILSGSNEEAFSESYIHIITDAFNNVYERTDESNNVSDDIQTIINIGIQSSDLVAESVNYPATGVSGSLLTVNWKVRNDGEITYAENWTDQIDLYTVNDKHVTTLGSYRRIESLEKDGSYIVEQKYLIPKTVPTGEYKIRLIADINNQVKDTDLTNNNLMSADIINITQKMSDLIVTDVKIIKADSDSTNYNIYAGQRFTFAYTVYNRGSNATDVNEWNDGFYLSRDTDWDITDLLIGSVKVELINDEFGIPIPFYLGSGDFYTDTLSLTLTTQAFGKYYFMVKADMQNDVYEYMAETNNSNYQYVEVNYTDVVDLKVSEVTIPENVSLEEETTVNYTVTNLGEFPAIGLIRDAVYVSDDNEWDSDDKLVTYLDREIELPANTTEKISANADFTRTLPKDSKGNPLSDSKDEMTDYLPGLEPGSYYIIVRTNITLSIREDINDPDKMANNICPSVNPFTVTLPEIEIDTRKEDTLAKEGVKYYQITVPDTSDVSLRVQLDRQYKKNTKDDAGTFNEMYIKYSSMPTLSNYDQSYDNPYSAKQEIIVPDTQPGIYYLMVKNNYHNEATQDITIDANLLGFELLYIDQSRGGNNGELTIKMTGTGFNYGVKPRLIKSGSGLNKTIDAKDTYYTDATELYATFDLRGADQGSYDAVLVQDMSRYEFTYKDTIIEGETVQIPIDMYLVPDSIVTTLPGIFTVEASNNRGSLEYKNIPENVRGGRGFESSIEVTNISNNDMIAPLYMLKVGWNEDFGPIKTKLPGEDSYTPGYKKFLILADEGPAGIIRPGAKGSVRIYATAPAVNEYMRFNMMKIQNSGFEFDFDAELFWTGADKNDPNWIETIYSIEQEVGNSWEGYNKVLVNQILEFDANSPKKKCLASKILLDKISFTKLKQNAEAAKGKSGLPKIKMLSSEEIIDNFLKNYCSDCGKGDVDCTPLHIAYYKTILRGAIKGFNATDFDYAANFLQYYIKDTTTLNNTVNDPNYTLTAFSIGFKPRTVIGEEADGTAEKDELTFKDINEKVEKYLRSWIEYKLKKDKNSFDGSVIPLHQYYTLADYEENPFVDMPGENIVYNQYSTFPYPSFYMESNYKRDSFIRRGAFSSEGKLFWAFGAMHGTKYVNAKITTKPIGNVVAPACSGDNYDKIDYSVELEYCFWDEYKFDTQDEWKSIFDEAASKLAKCGETTEPFKTYLIVSYNFTGTVVINQEEK